MTEFVINPEDAELFGLDGERRAKEAAVQLWNNCGEQLQKADDVLVRLSSSLGQGGLGLECLDYDDMEKRIRDGIDAILGVETGRREQAEAKYQKSINIIDSLLTTYGCKTKQWEEARTLIDQERPLLKESK